MKTIVDKIQDCSVIDQKKSNELRWLEDFRYEAGLDFEILEFDREKPDFLIEFEGRCVGVEVTEIHIDQSEIGSVRGSTLRKTRSNAEQIVARAQKLYLKTDKRNIHARFLFKGKYLNTNANMNDMANSIVEVLGELDLDEWERCRIHRDSTPATPKFLSTILLCGLPEQGVSYWQPIGAGLKKKLKPHHLISALEKKNQRINDYQRTVGENWLLIYANGWKAHGYFSRPVDSELKGLDSEFERTYVFCYPDGFLIQLKNHL